MSDTDNSELIETEHFVLKVYGKHNLMFKTKHKDLDYLKKVGEELISQKDTDYTHYEIHFNSEANEEMTHPEMLLHLTLD